MVEMKPTPLDIDLNGRVTIATWEMPKLEDGMPVPAWLAGRKFVTFDLRQRRDRMVMIIFPTHIAHLEILNTKGRGRVGDVAGAGFIRVDEDGELEAHGLSTSIEPNKHARQEDTDILRAYVQALEAQRAPAEPAP